MENQEYIIINKIAIQKRIENLEEFYMTARKVGLTMDAIDREIETLKRILSQSIPLIPEIEKAFSAGAELISELHTEGTSNCYDLEEYISNLKLDI